MNPIPQGKIGSMIVEKYFPSEEWEDNYSSITAQIKSISEYTGLNFNEVKALSYSHYLLYAKESWIYELKKSETGREFLQTLVELLETKADRKKLNEMDIKKIQKQKVVSN